MKQIRIGGRAFVLSQRRAADVLDLAAALEKQGEPDTIMNVLSMARVVCDSLASSYRHLGRIRGWRYRKFARPGGTAELLSELSTQEIMDAYADVFEVEGSKKKADLRESELVEKSAED